MKKKYYNDAFIGNKDVIASFSKCGELLRIYYPSPDYMQYCDYYHVGLKINDSNIIYLHNDINNKYNQYYEEDTNVLNTEIENTYFKLKIKQTDCAMINQTILLKKYVFKNENNIDLNLNFLVHSKVFSSYNNTAGGIITNDALVQYSHNYTCATFSREKLLSHQLNNVNSTINSGVIYDKDYIGMSADSAISYDLGVLKPGESKTFCMYIYIASGEVPIAQVEEEIDKVRRLDIQKEIEKVEKYWRKFVTDHDTLKLKSDGSDYIDKIIKIYKRTILLMPLLINEKTGGISASLEVDEERDKSGRYAYCWPRDAVLVYKALDFIGFDGMTKKFYENFLKKTQSKNGMWEQRFYTDGRLAPCWGYQIDETAIVVYGAYRHYEVMSKKEGKKDTKFLKDNLKMLEASIKFLQKYIDYITGKEEKEDVVRMELEKDYDYKNRDAIYKHPSYDLWENTEGIHLYSLSAIYCAFDSMIKIYEEVNDSYDKNRLKQDSIISAKKKLEEYKRETKKYILENLVDDRKNILLRNTEDGLADISVLGSVFPFRVFDHKEKVVENTIEQLNMTLRTYSGGYLRYQNDGYIGGNNPWINATGWMGLYFNSVGDTKRANECMNFIVQSANEHGFLAEQSNSDLNEKWVIGLAWSHAIFIELLVFLKKKF